VGCLLQQGCCPCCTAEQGRARPSRRQRPSMHKAVPGCTLRYMDEMTRSQKGEGRQQTEAAEKGPSRSQPRPAAAAPHHPPWPAHLTCLPNAPCLPLPPPPVHPCSVPGRGMGLAQPTCTRWGLGVVRRHRSPRPAAAAPHHPSWLASVYTPFCALDPHFHQPTIAPVVVGRLGRCGRMLASSALGLRPRLRRTCRPPNLPTHPPSPPPHHTGASPPALPPGAPWAPQARSPGPGDAGLGGGMDHPDWGWQCCCVRPAPSQLPRWVLEYPVSVRKWRPGVFFPHLPACLLP